MKRIKIIRKGVVTNQAEGLSEELDAWLASCLAKNKFGKPERWVREGDEDISAALETREVELAASYLKVIQIPAVNLDEKGAVINPALESSPAREEQIEVPAVMATEYKLAAQFTIVEEDITSEVEQAKTNQESLALLASTDWYVIRLQETGQEIPKEILSQRAAARAAIVR